MKSHQSKTAYLILAIAFVLLAVSISHSTQPTKKQSKAQQPLPWTQGTYTPPKPPGIGSKVPAEAAGLPGIYHPYPQPYPRGTIVAQCPDGTIIVSTAKSVLPTPYIDPFTRPPGTNLLPNVYTNAFDLQGQEIPNTLPSTQRVPYDLHDGDPIVTEINQISPTDDLHATFEEAERLLNEITEIEANIHEAAKNKQKPGLERALRKEHSVLYRELVESIQFGIKIIRGDSLIVKADGDSTDRRVYDRAYAGFPLLHYNALAQVKDLEPIYDKSGELVSANVDIRQVWYDSHIEADTAYINLKPLGLKHRWNQLQNVPWTITFTVDVLNRGHDDFSPWVMYMQKQFNEKLPIPRVDGKNMTLPKPLVGMDASFFPMEDGTRTVVKIKMAPPKYFKLSYTWGWRIHPPRIQVTEHLPQQAAFLQPLAKPSEYWAMTAASLPDHVLPPGCSAADLQPLGAGKKRPLLYFEQVAFCRDPSKPCDLSDPEAKDYAISRIGDLSPAKRMLKSLETAQRQAVNLKDADTGNAKDSVSNSIDQAQLAWEDWRDRTSLPAGIMVSDDGAAPRPIRKSPLWYDVDHIVVYVNNTMYGQYTDGALRKFFKWKLRDGAVNHTPPPPDNLNRLPKGAGQQLPEKSVLRLALINGDYFDHGYQSVDFGGARGWENQFKSSVKFGGSGCWFTFGRSHWWINIAGGAVRVPAAGPHNQPQGKYLIHDQDGNRLGFQRVNMVFNYEPSVRLRFYQFDPMHHNQCIFSQH